MPIKPITDHKSRAVRARAPLRLGFAGGGTDVSPYCDRHGGFVLNCAIQLYAHAHIEPRKDGKLVLVSADLNETVELKAQHPLATNGQARLICGVYNRMVALFNGGDAFGATITTHVDVPAGSGLGSSSALVVALIEAFKTYLQAPLGEYDIARLAFEIERRDLGLDGGRQDQYAAAFGGLNFMEFYADDRVIVNPLRLPARIERELEASILLYFTGATRESAKIIAQQVESLDGDDGSALEATHAVKAEAREMKEAILTGDLIRAAHTLRRGWDAKKKTALHVTNDSIDQVLDAALKAGARAGKVSGAGGGGFMMLFVDPSRAHFVQRALENFGGQVMTCRFSGMGSESWQAL